MTVDTEDTGKVDETGEPPEPEPSGEPATQTVATTMPQSMKAQQFGRARSLWRGL